MCNYQGYEFGGGYLDSICIDGRLFDADNGEHTSEGFAYYEPSQHLPCPQCQQLAAMSNYADDWLEDLDTRWPRYSAWHFIMDIRRNRGLRSIPLMVWMIFRFWHEISHPNHDWPRWRWLLRRWVW
jgi:hypothetical protein